MCDRFSKASLKGQPPKVECDEVTSAVIEELIDMQLDVKKEMQENEFYYNRVLQDYAGDPRTDIELYSDYVAQAKNKELDLMCRLNALKFARAIMNKMVKDRMPKEHKTYPCSNYKHSYTYVGGTSDTLSFVCKHCGEKMSTTSPLYASKDVRERTIKSIVSENKPTKLCNHDWINICNNGVTIARVCSKCGKDDTFRDINK